MQRRLADRGELRTLGLLVLLLITSLARAETSEIIEPVKLVTGPHYAPFAADDLPSKSLGPFLVERVSLHVMISKTHLNAQALITEFDTAFSAMKQAGFIKKWTQAYLEELSP